MSSFIPLSQLRRPDPQAPWWIRRREVILVPPERVWRALTDAAELRAWWCDEATVEPRVGGAYAFGGRHVFGSGPGAGDRDARAAILEIEEPARLAFRWPLLGTETTVTIELENHMEMTEINVTQTADRVVGWEPLGELPSWWSPALAALRSHLEKGRPDLRLDFVAVESPGPIRFEVGVTTFPWLIWDKLTQTRELQRWWAREASADPRAGGELRFAGWKYGPRRYEAVEPTSRLVHDWAWLPDQPATIEWRLEESDSDVRVSVSDAGPWPAELPRAAVAIHWASVLCALEQMSERGTSALEHEAR